MKILNTEELEKYNFRLKCFEQKNDRNVSSDPGPIGKFISDIRTLINVWIPGINFLINGQGDHSPLLSRNSTVLCVYETGASQLISCPLGTFECSDKVCISDIYVCDGFHDCSNGTDETGCSYLSCSALFWRHEEAGCVPYADSLTNVSHEWFYCDDGSTKMI